MPYSAHQSNGALLIENTQYDAAGYYECYINGQRPSDTITISTTQIVVQEGAPTIKFSPPMPMTVRVDQHVVIECIAEGTQPLNVFWHGPGFSRLPSTVVTYGNRLEFYQITLTDAGHYYCTATSPTGNNTKEAQVIVSPYEIIKSESYAKTHEVLRGDSVSLDCNVGSIHLIPGTRVSNLN